MENLFVSKSFCDDGPIMKRFMPKDRGKSYSIFKRMCHITVEVEEGQPPMTKAKRKQLGTPAGAAGEEETEGRDGSRSGGIRRR